MPAIFTPEFWDFANPEFWVGVGLAIFLGILFLVGAHKKIGASLAAKGESIQANLDEAARIRAEAEALLADINKQRADAEAQARDLIETAQEHAKRLAADAKVRLQEDLALRTQLAERKIEAAQAEAAAQVKAAAIDMAARATETVLAGRLAQAKSDPLVDRGISQLAAKLQ